jgi:hypothetical protein
MKEGISSINFRQSSSLHLRLAVVVHQGCRSRGAGGHARDLYIAKNQKLCQNQNPKWRNFAMAFILNYRYYIIGKAD